MKKNKGFTTPCFIRKNTPELRKKLEELGYIKNSPIWTDNCSIIWAYQYPEKGFDTPNYVIVWGRRLWKKLPSELKDTNICSFPEKSIKEYIYPNGHKIYFLSIYHPSGGFKIEYWKNHIKSFLEL